MRMKNVNQSVGLQKLCDLFGKTRQAFYDANWHTEDRIMQYDIILGYVYELRKPPFEKLGTEKLLSMLEKPLSQHNIKIGRDRLFDLLAAHGLLIRRRRKRKYTTDSNHLFRKYPYLIKDLIPEGPNEIWVADITYIRLNSGFAYLSIVTDVYSRKIMGYCLWKTLESLGPLNALKMAIKTSRKRYSELIHHSDRGIQYCCNEYVKCLELNKILISMTDKGSPHQNAIAERVNGILKVELGLEKTFRTFEEAASSVDNVIDAYNNIRPHSSCNYLTPNEAYKHEGKLEKKWKQYFKIAPTVLKDE